MTALAYRNTTVAFKLVPFVYKDINFPDKQGLFLPFKLLLSFNLKM